MTVIVTCYNLESYIREAALSVLDQDYEGDIELIVVDDASTDRSIATLTDLTGVRLVERGLNGGVLQAMLDGIAHASNDLVFLLDGDDLWEADKLRHAVQPFIERPAVGFVTHGLTYIDGIGGKLDRPNRVEQGLSPVSQQAQSAHLRRSIFEMRDDIWLGSAMGFRRSQIDSGGFAAFAMELDDPQNCYQDWPLAYWIAAQNDVDLAYVPRRLFRYRLHGANHSGDASSADRAARNFGRAANTLDAMAAIGERFAVQIGVGELRDRANSYRYLSSLYRGRSLASIGNFARSAASFQRRGLLLKELVRLIGALTLGPHRFAKLAARRPMAADLPLS